MSKFVIGIIIFFTNMFIALPCAGNIYVKNLHKKCVSNQQKCYLSCATSFPKGITPDDLSEEATKCADECLNEYIACEEDLARLRYLYRMKPLPDEATNINEAPLEEK